MYKISICFDSEMVSWTGNELASIINELFEGTPTLIKYEWVRDWKQCEIANAAQCEGNEILKLKVLDLIFSYALNHSDIIFFN